MDDNTKLIDRDFLHMYYKDMVNDIESIFEMFINEIPADLTLIKNLITADNTCEAKNLLHKISPSFYNIGLPHLTKKITEFTNVVNTNDKLTSLQFFYELDNELKLYMPDILKEYNRLKVFYD